MALEKPDDFWELRVHDVGQPIGVTGLCVGYEQNEWRYQAFADYIMEWLPEFCLNYKELMNLVAAKLVQKLRNAASIVYQSDEYRKRGEFGEILLHAAVRSVFVIEKSAQLSETMLRIKCQHVFILEKLPSLEVAEMKNAVTGSFQERLHQSDGT